MTHVKMKISGITMDTGIEFPFVMFRSYDSNRIFPLMISHEERNAIVSTMLAHRNPATGLIRKLITECHWTIKKISFFETPEGKLSAEAELKRPRASEKIGLTPQEAVMLALEFGHDVTIPEAFLKENRFFKRKMTTAAPEEPENKMIFDAIPAELEPIERPKKETVQ